MTDEFSNIFNLFNTTQGSTVVGIFQRVDNKSASLNIDFSGKT